MFFFNFFIIHRSTIDMMVLRLEESCGSSSPVTKKEGSLGPQKSTRCLWFTHHLQYLFTGVIQLPIWVGRSNLMLKSVVIWGISRKKFCMKFGLVIPWHILGDRLIPTKSLTGLAGDTPRVAMIRFHGRGRRISSPRQGPGGDKTAGGWKIRNS